MVQQDSSNSTYAYYMRDGVSATPAGRLVNILDRPGDYLLARVVCPWKTMHIVVLNAADLRDVEFCTNPMTSACYCEAGAWSRTAGDKLRGVLEWVIEDPRGLLTADAS